MINKNIIEEVKNKLIKTYNPLEIYLFGSYAWGNPDEDSDLDLLIVLDHYTKDKYHELVDGHKALINTRVSKDLWVITKEEFDRDSQDKTSLYHKIKYKGKRIYAKA